MNRYNSNRCGCNRTMADNRRVAGSMQQGCNRCNNNNNGNACGNSGNVCGNSGNACGSSGNACGNNGNVCGNSENVFGNKSGNSCEKKKDMKGFPVAMAYVPWQEWEDVYPLNKGLQRGTIFEALDKPFFKGRCRN